jgi:Ribosomal proteins L26 eukaryotic, L24P archaeal
MINNLSSKFCNVITSCFLASSVKINPNKTSSRRKMRKAHFGATSVERRVRMSCPLSKDMQMRYKVILELSINVKSTILWSCHTKSMAIFIFNQLSKS